MAAWQARVPLVWYLHVVYFSEDNLVTPMKQSCRFNVKMYVWLSDMMSIPTNDAFNTQRRQDIRGRMTEVNAQKRMVTSRDNHV